MKQDNHRSMKTKCWHQAKQQALAWLEKKFHLGGKGIKSRDALHDRKDLR